MKKSFDITTADYFGHFLQTLPRLSVHVILVLDVTFVPNLTFLGLLSPEILFGEKPSPTQASSLFRHPQCYAVVGTEPFSTSLKDYDDKSQKLNNSTRVLRNMLQSP